MQRLFFGTIRHVVKAIVTFIKMTGHKQTKSELIVTAATISVGLT